MKKSELKSLIQTCIVEVLKEDDKSDKVKALDIRIDILKKKLSDPTLEPEQKERITQSLNKAIKRKSEAQQTK